jgi:predicted chitinase
MYIKFNINQALKVWIENGGTTKFPQSLRDVLKFMQNDSNLTNIAEAAYLLATAKGESDFSLQRWESDYVCGPIGEPYKDRPCDAALNYYRATQTSSGKSKRNYYELGTDKNGLPYFGRGLIQLTGKSNYQKYGDLIGVDLVGDGDKALKPWNSYRIASTYLHERTFDYVNAGNLTKARKSVNGGTHGVDRVNASFNRWMKVFQDPSVGFKRATFSKTMRTVLVGTSVTTALVVAGIYFLAPEKTKLLR